MIQALNFRLQTVDLLVSLAYHLISISDLLLFDHDLLSQGFQFEVLVRHDLLQVTDFVHEVCLVSLEHLFCFGLLLLSGLFDSFVKFLRPLLDQGFLSCISLSSKLIFRVQLLSQELVILFVMLLYVGLKLFGVRLLESLNCLIVSLEFI